MKKLSLLAAIIFIGLTFTGCTNNQEIDVTADNYELITERGYIVVGMECAYAPFNWTVTDASAYDSAVLIEGSNNYCDGYDIEVASAIASGLGVDLVVQAIDWEGLIPSLSQSGQIDMIVAGMSPTAERAETVAFTDEYYISTHVIVLRSNSTYAAATSINDFAGASVVAQMSTIYDDLVDQLEGATHENPLGDVPTIVTAINAGTYDATILELPVAIAVCESNPELMYIEFDEGNGFDVSYEDRAVAIALRQSDITLQNEINAILATISTSTREEWMLGAIDRQPQ